MSGTSGNCPYRKLLERSCTFHRRARRQRVMPRHISLITTPTSGRLPPGRFSLCIASNSIFAADGSAEEFRRRAIYTARSWGTIPADRARRNPSLRPAGIGRATQNGAAQVPGKGSLGLIVNADAFLAGIRPATSAAGAASGRVAAGRCARARRSCCSGPPARHRRAANVRGPRNRD